MLVGWELLLVGAVAILATLGYSGGPRPYASYGLGEVMVFVFFGLVATAGSAYVQDGRLTLLPVLTAVPMGLFAVALLVVNNLRDIPTDEQVGKVTLAVKLGDRQTRVLFGMLIAGAYLSLAPIGGPCRRQPVVPRAAAEPVGGPSRAGDRAGRRHPEGADPGAGRHLADPAAVRRGS
jgi:1,4-dihydroxy-2-naphthoate polyprenyltransferase